MQAVFLCIKKDMFEQYYKDSLNISKESMTNIVLSNGSYTVPDALKYTRAKTLIVIGSKEIRRLDKSLRKLMSVIPGSQVCIVPGMRQGEFSLTHYMEYLTVIKHFMTCD